MITKEQVLEIIAPNLSRDHFLVDLVIHTGNKIIVNIDSMKGVSIDECAKLSRIIADSFDREIEDFELEVSSPGLSNAFKVKEQYQKYLGKTVEVLLNSGEKEKVKLISVSNNGIDIEKETSVKPEGKQKKVKVLEKQFIEFDSIKHTKLILTF